VPGNDYGVDARLPWSDAGQTLTGEGRVQIKSAGCDDQRSVRWASQNPLELTCVDRRVRAVIVIEIDPASLCAAGIDSVSPSHKLFFRIIVAVPPRRPVKANVDLLGGSDQTIGQAGSAARTEDNAAFTECSEDVFIPPTGMAELHDITTARIELSHDRRQASRSEVVTGRQLKQEAAHPLSQKIRDQAEIADKRFGSFESPQMCDQFADFDREVKCARSNGLIHALTLASVGQE
jgi:hypothetical protein